MEGHRGSVASGQVHNKLRHREKASTRGTGTSRTRAPQKDRDTAHRQAAATNFLAHERSYHVELAPLEGLHHSPAPSEMRSDPGDQDDAAGAELLALHVQRLAAREQ